MSDPLILTLHPTDFRIIFALGNNSFRRKNGEKLNVSRVARKIGATHSHCTNVVKKLENMGLVDTVRESRCKYLDLTDKGYEVYDLICRVDKVMGRSVK